MRVLACSLVAAAVLAGCGSGDDGRTLDDVAAGEFDADRAFADLEAQVAIGQRPAGSPASRETAELIAARLREAGVRDVRIQGPHLNVVGTIPGDQSSEAIVIGAHHDTKDDVGPGFEGANDGASGVAVVLELARALAPRVQGPPIHLALFDAEEARGDRDFLSDGLRGSRQYVEYARRGSRQGTPPLNEIGAMVLFDLVGDCDLQIPYEPNSSRNLYDQFAEGAGKVDGNADPFEGKADPILDDHIPFREAGIPAVDLIDFEFGPGPSPGAYWHTPEDTLDKVCAESLDAVGEAALRALPRPATP
jgi:Zn-dependent M28 family amino/carboxypeptidase